MPQRAIRYIRKGLPAYMLAFNELTPKYPLIIEQIIE